MIDRIQQLQDAAANAVARRRLEELEAGRIEYLGRKAELPNLLRGVAELPPEERGAVGRAANEARKALEARSRRRARSSTAAELDARLAADAVDVTLPGTPARSRSAACT